MILLLYIFIFAFTVYIVFGLLVLIGLFLPDKSKNTVKPFISVIIAARDEEKNISGCLNSVLNQSYDKEGYEVILINDRSTDKTQSIAENVREQYRNLSIITISDLPSGISPKKQALESGIKQSKGEILLFTDADCIVKNTWIESMVSKFRDDVGMVIGFSGIRTMNFFERFQSVDFLSLMTVTCGACNMGLHWAASGQNLGYRRKAFDEAGGFHSVMHRISGDDALMVQLIRRLKKWKIIFNMDFRSFNETGAQKSLDRLVHQRSRWASNATIMLRLNPLLFFYLLFVYIFYAGLFIGLITAFFEPLVLPVTGFAFLNKLIIDLLITGFGNRFFQRRFSFIVFITWFLFHLPYTLWIGLRGVLHIFHWK
jgi:cellulose synthase/poly-beta-1,6-N-acetylglucosamine synthase-like glycosyltransferase